MRIHYDEFSVPIRGLFNLTEYKRLQQWWDTYERGFRPHQGII